MPIVQRGALSQIAKWIPTDRKIMVVTDSGVPFNYVQEVLSACPQGYCYVFEQGEKNKTLDTVRGILAELLSAGFTRSDAVVAVGGGVVGDTAGFAASCYMRGIDFYNVPTTLLSQVDSSIGGKTGVDFGGVKNIVGAFHMPKAVVIDPDCLRTLDPRLLHEGLAEAIKMAATSDADLFSLIEEEGPLEPRLDRIISGALAIKGAVVDADPTEKGLRKVLNFGHTIGHAIEAAGAGSLFHGESVAAGMLYMCSDAVRARLEPLLRRYALPVSDPFDTETLMGYIGHDKKKQGDAVTAVYVDRIGSFEFRKMDMEQIRQCIQNHKNARI